MKNLILTLSLLAGSTIAAMEPSAKASFFNDEIRAVLDTTDSHNRPSTASASIEPKPARAIPLELTAPVMARAAMIGKKINFHAEPVGLLKQLNAGTHEVKAKAVRRSLLTGAEKEISESMRDPREKAILVGLIQKEKGAIESGCPAEKRPFSHFQSLLKPFPSLSSEAMPADSSTPSLLSISTEKLSEAEITARLAAGAASQKSFTSKK